MLRGILDPRVADQCPSRTGALSADPEPGQGGRVVSDCLDDCLDLSSNDGALIGMSRRFHPWGRFHPSRGTRAAKAHRRVTAHNRRPRQEM